MSAGRRSQPSRSFAPQWRSGDGAGLRAWCKHSPLIREDSWSPQESFIRIGLVRSGLPEPELNIDVYCDGVFLGCVDLAYPEYRVGIEYYGDAHTERFAEDVERISALRAAGWEMIEVTRALRGRPWVVAERVRRVLEERGWRGEI